MIAAGRFTKALGISAGDGVKLSVNSLRTMRRGHVEVGAESIIHAHFSFDRAEAAISVGRRCYIGKSHLVAAERITLGDDVVISWGVTIVDHDSHALDWDLRKHDIKNWHIGKKDWTGVTIRPVKIESGVWIGFNATILKGVVLGERSVVGACSVVTKDVPPGAVVAGNPARIVRWPKE